MPQELKFKSVVDNAAFQAGMNRLEQMGVITAQRLQGSLGAAFKNLGAPILKVPAAALAAIGANLTSRAIVSGISNVFDAGRALQQLSRQTGASVSGLVILQSKFKAAGLESDGVGHSIARLQKSLAGVEDDENKGGSAQIQALGLNLQTIKRLAPEAQFLAVGSAIAKIVSPAERTAAAMKIFGREGAELTGVFSSPGFATISPQMQQKADIMAKNAAAFEKASIALAASGTVFKSFYLGAAEGAVGGGKLNETLDKLKAMNLANVGKLFGEGIAAGAAALMGVLNVIDTRIGQAEKANHDKKVAEAQANVDSDTKQLNDARVDLDKPEIQNNPLLKKNREELVASMSQILATDQGKLDDLTGKPADKITISARRSMFKDPLPTESEHFKRPFVVGGKPLDWGEYGVNYFDETMGGALDRPGGEVGLHGGKDNPFMSTSTPWAQTQDGLGINASYGRTSGATGGNIWSQISGRTGGGAKDSGEVTAKNTKDIADRLQIMLDQLRGGSGGGGGGGVTATQ